MPTGSPVSCGGHYVGVGRYGKDGQLRYRCSNNHTGATERCTYKGNGYKTPMKERLEDEVWSGSIGLFRHAPEDGWERLGSDVLYAPQVDAGSSQPTHTWTRCRAVHMP